MDASSQYQDTLPISSDALLAKLDDWGLSYTLHSHIPLRTVEEAKTVEADLTVPGEAAFRTKNLYLRDRKKRNYLVTLEQDREIDLKALGVSLGVGGLSFGSPDRLMQFLGVRPGAVSPLAMINGVGEGVKFFMDGAAQQADTLYIHPLVNDRTLAMPRADFLTFMDHIGCAITWLE
jgi:Ala-tRNA(Pro) deacylase